MSLESPTSLETLKDSQTEIIPWEEVDCDWKRKIEDALVSDTPPCYLICPQTGEKLAQIIGFACENNLKVLPCGNGTKLNWGGLVQQPQLIVSTQRMNRIIEHAVGDLTVTVEAGVKLADLQASLQPYHQFFPIDTAYPDSATIGGIMATADSGSWRQRYGGFRDLVLGLSFIRADGKIAKAGGRVVKNVAGYDMMKLFTGSYGTLGIISQVTLRLYPLVSASVTLVFTGDRNSLTTLTQTIRMSSLTPTSADVLSTGLVTRLGIGAVMGLIIRFQSIPESVDEQASQLHTTAQRLGLHTNFYQHEQEDNLWKRLRETITVTSSSKGITGKIGILPHQMVNFLHHLDGLTTKAGLAMINIASGVGRLNLDEDDSLSYLPKLRSLLEGYQGYLTILEAPKELKQKFEPWGYTGNGLDLMSKLKQKFDPNNILSPGRFVGGI